MAQIKLWILNGRVPEACLDYGRWLQWFEQAIASNEATIARTDLMDGDVIVVTRFHGFMELHGKFEPPPMLFETVVLGHAHLGELMGLQTNRRERIDVRSYPTWEAAEKGHQAVLERFRALADAAAAGAAALLPALTQRPSPTQPGNSVK